MLETIFSCPVFPSEWETIYGLFISGVGRFGEAPEYRHSILPLWKVLSSALVFASSLQTWILSSKPLSGLMTFGQREEAMSSSCWWGTKLTWQTRGNGGELAALLPWLVKARNWLISLVFKTIVDFKWSINSLSWNSDFFLSAYAKLFPFAILQIIFVKTNPPKKNSLNLSISLACFSIVYFVWLFFSCWDKARKMSHKSKQVCIFSIIPFT